MTYTKAEQRELHEQWLDETAKRDPEFAESLVREIIAAQREKGLIGRPRPLPPKFATRLSLERGENNGTE